jgi:hypothetical protein
MTVQMPQNVYELINETITLYNSLDIEESYANCLINIIKKYHLWPSMQVKKFKNNNNLVLLHNTYKRQDVERYKELYEQCRSVILDFTASVNNNIVVSYANNIPDRININEYSKILSATDLYQEAFDGTMITVYKYDNTWHIGTSSCADINQSKFNNPNKTHGYMLDEILMTYFRSYFTDDEVCSGNLPDISKKLRDILTSHLDPNIAYEFVMVHHNNPHIIDYTTTFGPNYKLLYHINSKNRYSLQEVDISHKPLANLGILYPAYYQNLNDAFNHMNSNQNSYGFIAKKLTDKGIKLYKISPEIIDFAEDTNPCNPNVWHNILMVYMKNRKDYKINDYIRMYAPDLQLPYDDKGNTIDATYLVHTMISTLRDVLYKLYVATTTYNSKTNRFKMNKELDKQFPPVIRFHLAQLRHKQQYDYPNNMLRQKDVYHYLCHCNNVKNIKLLITLFSTNIGYDITDRAALCLTILNGLL